MVESKSHLPRVDATIDRIIQQLPHYPRLLTPAAGTPLYRNTHQIYEHEGLPFDTQEIGRGLQYMSMLNSPTNRGISFTEGGWEDTTYSPLSLAGGARSQTTTPDPNKPRVKMSLADYKKAPKRTAEELKQAEKQRELKQKEDAERRKKGRTNQLQAQAQKDAEKNESRKRERAEKEKRERRDGHNMANNASPDANKIRDLSKRREEEERQKDALERKEALRQLKELNNKKTEAEKLSARKSMAVKPQKPLATASSARSQGLKSSEALKIRAPKSSTGNSKKLPPMLSPLPADLGHEDEDEAADSTLDERVYRFPTLLSPSLPPEIEEALSRLHENVPEGEANLRRNARKDSPSVDLQPSSSRSTNTSAVARKSVKAKDRIDEHASARSVKDSSRLIVRLRYGKRNVRNVDRLMNMKPKPSQSFVDMQKRAREEGKRAEERLADAKLIEDKRLAEKRAEEKKRPRDADDHDEPPSAKRLKVPATVDATPSRNHLSTPIKSPGLPPRPSSQQANPSTPTKTEAMARVSSHDGRPSGHGSTNDRSHTPSGPIWTASSASLLQESRAQVPGGTIDTETLRKQFDQNQTLGTTLKRRMDAILHTKMPKPPALSQDEEKLGALVGIESITAYMIGYSAYATMRRMEKKSNDGLNWMGLLGLLPFVIGRAKPFPELYVLAQLVNAISRESLAEIHVERMMNDMRTMSDKDISKFKDAVSANSRQKPAAWQSYADSLVQGMTVVHPGASVTGSAVGIVKLLQEYANKNNLKWEKQITV